MGNLATQSYRLVATIGLYTLVGTVWLLLQTRQLNLLSLGEEGALQLGVDVDRTRRAAFLGASLLVGAVVSVSGMIGFVGLIVPHVMRLLRDGSIPVRSSFRRRPIRRPFELYH
jgi:iron complex transport system permease protein